MMIHVRGERVAYDVHLCVHVFIIPWKRDVLACALVIVNCAGIFAQGLSFNEIHASEYIAVNIMHACVRYVEDGSSWWWWWLMYKLSPAVSGYRAPVVRYMTNVLVVI